MSEHVTTQEALRRVEDILCHLELRRKYHESTLQLLTEIADTLEATKPFTEEKCGAPAAQSEVASRAFCSFSLTNGSVGAVAISDESITAALAAVERTLAKLRRDVCATLTRLSCRVQAVTDSVHQLRAAAETTAAAVEEHVAARRERRVLEAAAFAAVATVASLSCGDAEDWRAGGSRPAISQVPPSFAAAAREDWRVKEEAAAIALRGTVDVHDSTAHTACRLLRSTLLETLSSQRWFPSRRVYHLRRDARHAWYREMRELYTQRLLARRARWERHEKLAGFISESEGL